MSKDTLRQLALIVTTLFTLVMNTAANVLPLNGRLTGDISDSFKVVFVPAGYVFSIWGIIYIALIAFTVFHSLPGKRDHPLLRSTGWLAALSNLCNGLWIYFWHFGYYDLTLLVMLGLLLCLIAIYLRLGNGKVQFPGAEKWLIAIPFSIYLGWITVATIANATDLLAYHHWSGWGLSAVTWTQVLLAVTVVLAALVSFARADIAWSLVLVWALVGIARRWPELPAVSTASYTAAGLVALLLVAGRLSHRKGGLV